MIRKDYGSIEENRDVLIPSVVQQNTQRRQQIARYIYDVWTHGGAEICGLAEPVLLDGRLDILSSYVIEYYTDINDEQSSSDPLVRVKTTEIDVVDASNLSYDNFSASYMYQNIPVVIKGLSDSWSCCRDWVKQDPTTGRSVPNLCHILQCYGNETIAVHSQPAEGFQCPQQRPETSSTYNMTVADYITWWKKDQVQHHESECDEETLLYLKDWKFVSSHPTANIYRCPELFYDDWLNDAKNSSYKFIYLGRKGTVTAFHADVLRSFSWWTNIVGMKQWYFIAPQHSHLLYDCFGTKLAFHLHADIASTIENDEISGTEHQTNDYMSVLYPGLRYARQHAFSVLQKSGETIFVPSNWFHTVENTDDTLSINHNWLNGANIRKSWQYINSKVRCSRALTNNKLNTCRANRYIASTATDIDAVDSIERIDDDVLLIWEVVQKKAKEYIELQDSNVSAKQIHDLFGVLYVVDGILSLYKGRELSKIESKKLEKVIQLRYAIATLLHYR